MTVSTTPAKTRSPNYPAISLEEAIQRLRVIYEKQRRYPATREVIVRLMGYKSLNGASATIVSALSKYGLLEGHGDSLRVSDLGQDLVLHRKGDPEYTNAVRSAALMPAFFRELRDQYPQGLPHEHHLRATLTKRGFNPKVIDSAVRAYRDTFDFVDAETDGETKKSTDDPPPSPTGNEAAPPAPVDPRQKSVQLPLSVSEWATLYAPFPLSEAAWHQMMAVLAAMKPALVASTATPESPAFLVRQTTTAASNDNVEPVDN